MGSVEPLLRKVFLVLIVILEPAPREFDGPLHPRACVAPLPAASIADCLAGESEVEEAAESAVNGLVHGLRTATRTGAAPSRAAREVRRLVAT